jgi:hypothetical protein
MEYTSRQPVRVEFYHIFKSQFCMGKSFCLGHCVTGYSRPLYLCELAGNDGKLILVLAPDTQL